MKSYLIKIFILSLALLPVFITGWLTSNFALYYYGVSGLNLIIPTRLNSYLIVDFVLQVILPIFFVNWILIWLKVYCGINIIQTVYPLLSFILCVLYLLFNANVIWGLNISNDEYLSLILIQANRNFVHEVIFLISVAITVILLILHLYFQPRLGAKEKKK